MMPGNPVVGSTVLRRPAIQSPNFVQSPLAGWAINADGTAYFANVTAQGTIAATSFTGTTFVINSAGLFIYSAAPAAGNLAESSAPAAGTDGFGNHYVVGHASYNNADGVAASLDIGLVQFYAGSLSAGWTASGSVGGDPAGDILLTPASGRGVLTSLNTLDNGSGAASVVSLTVNGSADTATAGLTDGTINGSCTNAGLTNGQITGTSGAASAGTAHTHGGGSYAVTNGQHAHGSGTYAVTNGTHQHAF